MPVYRRPPEAYVRPGGRVNIRGLECADRAHTRAQERLDWSQKCCYLVAVRGTEYLPEAFEGSQTGTYWFEMVPEPGNPFDPFAVALDLEGRLAGYIPARLAAAWQWKILSLNSEGSACFVPGRIDKRGVVVCLAPNSQDIDSMVHLDKRISELRSLYDDLPQWARDEMERTTFVQVNSKQVWKEWIKRQGQVPSINLPEDLAAVQEHNLLTIFFIERRHQVVAARAEERRRVAEERKLVALEEAQARREKRKAAREQKQAVVIEALLEEGGNVAATARRLGVSEETVRAARGRAGLPPSGLPPDQAKSRVTNGRQALALFEAGNSRAEIATVLGIGVPRVKDLLSLARFLQDPNSEPDRLRLAAQARREEWTKSTAPAGVRFRRAMTDARDLDEVQGWPAT